MRLIIRNEGRDVIEIPCVTLQDGYIPAIALQGVDGTERFDTFPMEPARWFKVTLLDWIKIDCTHKKEKIQYKELCPKYKNNVNQFFKPDEGEKEARDVWPGWVSINFDTTYFHSNMQHAFVMVREAVAKCIVSSKARREIFKILMKVLHVHILPCLRLEYRKDWQNLTSALEDQKYRISVVKSQMQLQSTDFCENKKRLCEKRNKIVKCLLRGEGRHWLTSTPFVKQLQKDLEQDVEQLEVLLSSLERKKEVLDGEIFRRLSSLPSCAPLPEEVVQLLVQDQLKILEQMEELNEIYHNFKDCSNALNLKMQSRKNIPSLECLKAMCDDPDRVLLLLDRFQNPGRYKKMKRCTIKHEKTRASMIKVEHKMYLSMACILKKHKQDLEELAGRNKALNSVAVAMSSALQELNSNQDGESYGVARSAVGNGMATDVLDQMKKQIPSDWSNLAEVVMVLISDEATKVGKFHQEFCRNIISWCQLIEKEINDSSTIEMVPPSSKIQVESLGVAGSMCVLMPSSKFVPDFIYHARKDQAWVTGSQVQGSPYEYKSRAHEKGGLSFLEEVIQKVQGHIGEVCKLVSAEINFHGDKAHRNIYVCYEYHLYSKIMPAIELVYEKFHLNIVRRLGHVLPTLDVASLKLDSSFTRSMLQVEPVESIPRPRRNSSLTSSNFSLRFPPHFGKRSSISSSMHSRTSSASGMSRGRVSGQFVEEVSFTESEASHDCHCTARGDASIPSRASLAWRSPDQTVTEGNGIAANDLDLRRPYPTFLRGSPLIEESSLTESEMMQAEIGSTTESAQFENSDDLSLVSMKLKSEMYPSFKPAILCLERATTIPVPLSALKSLHECSKKLEEITYNYCLANTNKEHHACEDDVLDMLQVLLCNCQVDLVMRLYVRILVLDGLVEMAPRDSFSFLNKYVREDGKLSQVLTDFACMLDRLADV